MLWVKVDSRAQIRQETRGGGAVNTGSDASTLLTRGDERRLAPYLRLRCLGEHCTTNTVGGTADQLERGGIYVIAFVSSSGSPR